MYEKTHPWLSFRLDMRELDYRLWVLLGEAQSKCEHIAGVPLRPSTADYLHRLFLAKGALATTAIEGNTLTQAEVLKRLDGDLQLPPSKEYLGREIDNIVQALDAVFHDAASLISPGDLLNYNRLVLDGLPLAEGVVPGEIRNYEVTVGRYRGAPASDCPLLLGKLCEWLNGSGLESPDGLDIAFGVLRAIVAHLYIAWIHPFGDGNGRTARLIEFKILVASGVPTPAAHLLSNHYNQTRQEYYRRLENASTSNDGILQFVRYAVQGFVDGLREQIEVIRDQQWDVAWRNYVYEECAKEQNENVERRRRHLVLDLSGIIEPVAVVDLPTISARVAQEYAKKSYPTLARDVDALVEEGLLLRKSGGVLANRSKILAFLPARKHRD